MLPEPQAANPASAVFAVDLPPVALSLASWPDQAGNGQGCAQDRVRSRLLAQVECVVRMISGAVGRAGFIGCGRGLR